MTKNRVRTSLQRSYIDFQAWAEANSIYHRFVTLRAGIYGFVYRSRLGNYYIIINKNLTVEMQKEVFCHEVEHILQDLPDSLYIIGLDMQYERFEREASYISKEVLKGFA